MTLQDNVQQHSLESVQILAKKRKKESVEWESHQPSFSQLVTSLRHAFAHNCFALVGDESQPHSQREIIGLRVWNTPPKKDYKMWEAALTIGEL